MRRTLVAYATTEGQTEKVATRVADALRDRTHDVTLAKLGDGDGNGTDPAAFDADVRSFYDALGFEVVDVSDLEGDGRLWGVLRSDRAAEPRSDDPDLR
ncbi:hypothetical protein ACFQE1_13800 [Halobium palmae]|uniref:Flavodoxin-like domain-containing protein n=1 Tax=Halobium palmae TaxID=1776492 RepID=A0ABD5S164_9EURY